jgi:hypothetical protein
VIAATISASAGIANNGRYIGDSARRLETNATG